MIVFTSGASGWSSLASGWTVTAYLTYRPYSGAGSAVGAVSAALCTPPDVRERGAPKVAANRRDRE